MSKKKQSDTHLAIEHRVSTIAAALVGRSFQWVTEADFQERIGWALDAWDISFEREKRLSAADRVDFWCPPVAVEVKVAGALSDVTRQLVRYADLDIVEAVVLVTTKMRHRNMPSTMRGKPLRVVYIGPL